MAALSVILIAAAGVLLTPVAVFCAECFLAMLPMRVRRESGTRPAAIVLIPAHNEESGIDGTLRVLIPTLAPGDRVLVVADNCSDRTAEVARSCGADVVERQDPDRRGKGYALEFGLRSLGQPSPVVAGEDSATSDDRVIVFLDADCRVTPDTVNQLARAVARTKGPVQGLNLSEAEASGVQAVSSLGFHFKNLVRPTGLARIGMPCHLMGTGMALPAEMARKAAFAGTNLVEDMQLGVDLAISRTPATFCRTALVTSRLPTGKSAFLSQRTRWEHGHLRTSLTQIPRLLCAFLRSGDVRLLALAIDLTVPPFSMLIFGCVALWSVSLAAWLLGSSAVPFGMLTAGGAAVALAAIGGWAKFCRAVVPFRTLASVPIYMLKKLPIYFSFLTRRGQREWVRTDREAIVPKA